MVDFDRNTLNHNNGFRSDITGMARNMMRFAKDGEWDTAEGYADQMADFLRQLNEGAHNLEQQLAEAQHGRDRLLEVVQHAYRKHHMGDERIGWQELADMLHTRLCEAMEMQGVLDWTDAVRDDMENHWCKDGEGD